MNTITTGTETPITLDGNPITDALDCARAIGDPTQTDLYLHLDYETGRITVETEHQSSRNSCGGDVWHCRARRWRLDRCPNALHLVAMFAAETDATALVERIVAGYCEGYNNQMNLEGCLTIDGQEARDELDRAIEDAGLSGGNLSGEGATLWAAGDWMEMDPPTVTADTPIDALAIELRSDAECEGIVLYGLASYLEELRTN